MGCKFEYDPSKKPDAAFGLTQEPGVATVLRSMESASYYSENNIALARRWVSTLHLKQTHFFPCNFVGLL